MDSTILAPVILGKHAMSNKAPARGDKLSSDFWEILRWQRSGAFGKLQYLRFYLWLSECLLIILFSNWPMENWSCRDGLIHFFKCDVRLWYDPNIAWLSSHHFPCTSICLRSRLRSRRYQSSCLIGICCIKEFLQLFLGKPQWLTFRDGGETSRKLLWRAYRGVLVFPNVPVEPKHRSGKVNFQGAKNH